MCTGRVYTDQLIHNVLVSFRNHTHIVYLAALCPQALKLNRSNQPSMHAVCVWIVSPLLCHYHSQNPASRPWNPVICIYFRSHHFLAQLYNNSQVAIFSLNWEELTFVQTMLASVAYKRNEILRQFALSLCYFYIEKETLGGILIFSVFIWQTSVLEERKVLIVFILPHFC